MIRAEFGFLQCERARVILGGLLGFGRLRRKITQVAQQLYETLPVAAGLGQPHGIVAAFECIGYLIGGLRGLIIMVCPQEVG